MEALSFFFFRLLVTLKLNPFYCFFYFRCWRWRWPFATENRTKKGNSVSSWRQTLRGSIDIIHKFSNNDSCWKERREKLQSFPSLISLFLLNSSEVRIANKSVTERGRVRTMKSFPCFTFPFLLSFQVFSNFSIVSQNFSLFMIHVYMLRKYQNIIISFRFKSRWNTNETSTQENRKNLLRKVESNYESAFEAKKIKFPEQLQT